MSSTTLYFTPQFRVSDFSISSAPSLATYNNLLYMAWRGADDANNGDDKIFYASFNGNGSAWSAQARVSDFGISSSPALCVYNGLLYMAWRGAGDGADKIYYASFNGTSWSGQARVSDFSISGSPALAIFDDRLYMAWRGAGGSNHKIFYASFDGTSWSPQSPNGGMFYIENSPALCAYNRRLYMTWRDNSDNDATNKIMYASFDGISWSEEQRVRDYSITSSPALCVFDNLMFMVWQGAGSGGSSFFYASFNGSWSGQARAGSFGTSDNAALAVYGASLAMTWRGSGDGDDKIYNAFTYTEGITNWMHASYNLLRDHSLKEICIPGAHDAAMYVSQNCSTGADACNTQTQYKTMLGMLEAGVRYFDMRPVIDTNNTMYCGHFSDVPVIGISGCDGDLLQNMLDGVKEFMQAGARELVILKFSHYLDRNNDIMGFTEAQMNTLIQQVKNTLGSYLFVNNTGQRLADIPFSSLIATSGTVFAVFDLLPPACRTTGIYSYADYCPDKPSMNADLVVYDCYADSNDLDEMISDQFEKLENGLNHGGDLFLLSWTLTLSNAQSALGTACINELATEANTALVPNITTWYEAGNISEAIIPNIIYVDFADGWTAATCVELNRGLLTTVKA
ncbi:MAG TPA: hypothetical protein VHI13_00645 [Candidatus Kapabacteria bacterium]|nr:hypothetical protein [Candidatus Kapabacteria bacterium]